MATIQLELSRDHLLQAIEQLDADDLTDLVSDVLHLRARRYAPILDNDESELFLLINQRLTAAQQAWRAELLDKLDEGTLTEIEHQELIQLNDETEILNAQRVEALSELAALRRITLPQLMHDLGLDTSANA